MASGWPNICFSFDKIRLINWQHDLKTIFGVLPPKYPCWQYDPKKTIQASFETVTSQTCFPKYTNILSTPLEVVEHIHRQSLWPPKTGGNDAEIVKTFVRNSLPTNQMVAKHKIITSVLWNIPNETENLYKLALFQIWNRICAKQTENRLGVHRV